MPRRQGCGVALPGDDYFPWRKLHCLSSVWRGLLMSIKCTRNIELQFNSGGGMQQADKRPALAFLSSNWLSYAIGPRYDCQLFLAVRPSAPLRGIESRIAVLQKQ
jgi:hypothetical protein